VTDEKLDILQELKFHQENYRVMVAQRDKKAEEVAVLRAEVKRLRVERDAAYRSNKHLSAQVADLEKRLSMERAG
jgi:hypothetical protein